MPDAASAPEGDGAGTEETSRLEGTASSESSRSASSTDTPSGESGPTADEAGQAGADDRLELDFEGFGEPDESEGSAEEVPEWAKAPAGPALDSADSGESVVEQEGPEQEAQPSEEAPEEESEAFAEESEAGVVSAPATQDSPEVPIPEPRTEAVLYREVRLTAHGEADA